MNISVKNFEPESWKIVKEESARHNTQIGRFLSELVHKHHVECKGSNFKEILFGEKCGKNIFSSLDAKKIREDSRKSLHLRS